MHEMLPRSSNKKILVVHNFYRTEAPSGEDAYVESEVASLERAGFQVQKFYVYSDDFAAKNAIEKALSVMQIPWNFSIKKAFVAKLGEFKPDVVHIHNIFPFLSPAIYQYTSGYKVVTTLHNYRYFCAAAVLLRNGRVCTKCIDGSPISALVHRCYRGAALPTLILSLMIRVLRHLCPWSRADQKFLAFSSFQSKLLEAAGVPHSAIAIKPNFVERPSETHVQSTCVRDEKRVVYVGRISVEKGIEKFLKSWTKNKIGSQGLFIEVLGDGEDLDRLRVDFNDHSINFTGRVSNDECIQKIRSSALVVIPSLCFEGFPTVLLEAFATSTPVLVSNIGPLPELIGFGSFGYLYDPFSDDELADKFNEIFSPYSRAKRKASSARVFFEEKLSEKTNIERLNQIYGDLNEKTLVE